MRRAIHEWLKKHYPKLAYSWESWVMCWEIRGPEDWEVITEKTAYGIKKCMHCWSRARYELISEWTGQVVYVCSTCRGHYREMENSYEGDYQ